MFGNRYFGARYFGDRYFGPGGNEPVPDIEPVRRHGGISPELARRLDREREEFEQQRVNRDRALRDAIERAFADPAPASSPEPDAASQPSFDGTAIANAALALAAMQGIAAGLDEMLALIEAYQVELALQAALARELDDEDAIIAILLAA